MYRHHTFSGVASLLYSLGAYEAADPMLVDGPMPPMLFTYFLNNAANITLPCIYAIKIGGERCAVIVSNRNLS
jgi:hypothetical protein